MLVEAVGIVAITAIGGAAAGLDVGHLVLLSAEDAEKGFRGHGAGADFGIVGFVDDATTVGPVFLQLKNSFLKGIHSNLQGLQYARREETAFDVNFNAMDEGTPEVLRGFLGPCGGVKLADRFGEHVLGEGERFFFDAHFFEEPGQADSPKGKVREGQPDALLAAERFEHRGEQAEEFFVGFVGGQQLFTEFGDEIEGDAGRIIACKTELALD